MHDQFYMESRQELPGKAWVELNASAGLRLASTFFFPWLWLSPYKSQLISNPSMGNIVKKTMQILGQVAD